MSTVHHYPIRISWKHDRLGEVTSSDTDTALQVATPPAFPKGMAGYWSPEHLFTAAISSCLMTTFLAIAENSQLSFQYFDCDAEGKLEQIEGKWLMTQVMLFPRVVIMQEEDRAKADRILHKAKEACLISRSVKSEVLMQPTIEVAVAAEA